MFRGKIINLVAGRRQAAARPAWSRGGPASVTIGTLLRTPALAGLTTPVLIDFHRNHEQIQVLDGPTEEESITAEMLGQAGIAMGTRFLLTAESRVPDDIKARIADQDLAPAAIRADDPRTLVIDLPQPTDPVLVLYTLATSMSAYVLDREAVLAQEQADRGPKCDACDLRGGRGGAGASDR